MKEASELNKSINPEVREGQLTHQSFSNLFNSLGGSDLFCSLCFSWKDE